ncbi:MAG: hypothetical protein WBX11_05015 [Thiobacillaceae bacterium]
MKSLSLLVALALSTAVYAAEPMAPVNPHADMGMHGPMLTESGKVLSTINVPSYTYVELSQGKKTIWLAASTVVVKKGDTVRFDKGMEMNNFYSRTLKRTFPSIIFVSSLVVDKGKK